MKIYIITMDDPVFTLDFFHEIIKKRSKDIVGIAITNGGRLKIGKNRSKLKYLLSLFLIMGAYHFFKNALITIRYKFHKRLVKRLRCIKDYSLAGIALEYNIPAVYIDSPNNRDFLEYLITVSPDVIINQSQHILKKQLLAIPQYGVLNRHNALLPKNRGRLTPFWIVFKGESETGVTIHLVDEGIDSGPIVVQKRFNVEKNDTFNTIAKKNYEIASVAMLEALTKLENKTHQLLENNSDLATYNTVPTLVQAFYYRWYLIKRFLSSLSK